MSGNPFAPRFEELPATLPIFPLSEALLLPTGNLPLNIFEPRYLQMVQDALGSHRVIGMIQPKEEAQSPNSALYEIGCAGKITDFSETPDGRFLVTLTGICRFKMAEELEAGTLYRQIRADWAPFKKDLEGVGEINLDRARLHSLLQMYFSDKGLNCDWSIIEKASDGKLITCLSMICPFDTTEKQALLEAPSCKMRADTFMTMLEMAVHEKQLCLSEH